MQNITLITETTNNSNSSEDVLTTKEVEEFLNEELKNEPVETLNWVAKLQLTKDLPITFEGEEGYEEAKANHDAFLTAHYVKHQEAYRALVAMTDKFVQGEEEAKAEKEKAARKAKKKAYQAKLQSQREETKRLKAEAKARAERAKESKRLIRQVEKNDPAFSLKVKKARDQRIAANNRIVEAYEDHLSTLPENLLAEAKAEYKRLTEICLMVPNQAMKRIMKSYK